MKRHVRWLMVFLVQNVHEVEEDTIFMDMTLRELLELKAVPDIAVVGCLSTTMLSQALVVELDKGISGKGRVFNFVVEILIGQDRGKKRLRVLDEPSSGRGLNNGDAVTGVFNTILEHYTYDHVLLTTLDHGSGFAIFAPPDDPLEKASKAGGPAGTVRASKGPASMASMRNEFPQRHLYALSHRFSAKRHSSAPKAPEPGITRALINGIARAERPGITRAQINGMTIAPKRTLRSYQDRVAISARNNEPAGLTMDELHLAIKKTFGKDGRKIDVIFMRNCFMQMFDTGYTLQDVTKYLVAFESLMWFPAYNYAIWLKAMVKAGKDLTAETVVKAALQGFTRAKIINRFRRDTALFGNELEYYPDINDMMNTMIRELIGFVEGHKGRLLECREGIIDIVRRDYKDADYQLVDGRRWFEQAGKLLKDNETYQEALTNFLVLHEAIVANRAFVGKLLEGGRYHESGFSLYFPNSVGNIARDGSFYSLYYDRHSQTRSRFSRYSLWPEFIAYLFLDIKPKLPISKKARRL